MQIPERIKIGGIIYHVKNEAVVSRDNHNIDGEVNYSEQIIRLKDVIQGEYREAVFIHEIVHAMFEFCGIEQDENIVSRLSNALHMVIKDNPEIFEKAGEQKEAARCSG